MMECNTGVDCSECPGCEVALMGNEFSTQQKISDVEERIAFAYNEELPSIPEIEELEHELEMLHNEMDMGAMTIYK